MNQQLIDQLIKLATIRVNNPLVNSDGKVVLDDWEEGVSMSKLIELTVRECAKACEKNSYLALNGWQRAKQIQEHFGVKE